MRRWKREAKYLQRQLDMVDGALGKWESHPESTAHCVGRVQTILNLKADRRAYRDHLCPPSTIPYYDR